MQKQRKSVENKIDCLVVDLKHKNYEKEIYFV